MAAESAVGRGSDGELVAAGLREGALRHRPVGQRGALQARRGTSGRSNRIEIGNQVCGLISRFWICQTFVKFRDPWAISDTVFL